MTSALSILSLAIIAGLSQSAYPADAMAQAGGKMEFKEMWTPNVVVDRELITGQNPFSDELLTERLLQQLNSQPN